MSIFLLFGLVTAINFSDFENRGVPRVNLSMPVSTVRPRRYVHRRSCVGIVRNHSDTIRCVEAQASMFEHMVTPSSMWCNEHDCESDFNEVFVVHSIVCTPVNCTVLFHCAEALENIEHACLLTVLAIVIIAISPLYLPFARIKAAWESRRRWMTNKNL